MVTLDTTCNSSWIKTSSRVCCHYTKRKTKLFYSCL